MTPQKQDIVSRKDFLTPATILQIHIRGRHRGVRRCETGKPGSVLHRGSVNMSRGSPCRCGHGSKRKDPTLGCRRNRVFLRPFQIGNSWQRKSVGMWGPKRLAHSDVQHDSIVPASRIRPGAYQRACLMTTHCSPNDHRRVAVGLRHTFRHPTGRSKLALMGEISEKSGSGRI